MTVRRSVRKFTSTMLFLGLIRGTGRPQIRVSFSLSLLFVINNLLFIH